MKLLSLDSSLELVAAQEVMTKLTANDGKVPEDPRR
jgi:hypothetical protein